MIDRTEWAIDSIFPKRSLTTIHCTASFHKSEELVENDTTYSVMFTVVKPFLCEEIFKQHLCLQNIDLNFMI